VTIACSNVVKPEITFIRVFYGEYQPVNLFWGWLCNRIQDSELPIASIEDIPDFLDVDCFKQAVAAL
jgi:hypothetical protein